MTELCVMCGNVLPTESNSQVCRTCELTAHCSFLEFNCPECKSQLEIYHRSILDYVEPHADGWHRLSVGVLYHCRHCGCDWSSEYTEDWGDTIQTDLRRHYWG